MSMTLQGLLNCSFASQEVISFEMKIPMKNCVYEYKEYGEI
jgi:hypothetical protein